MQETVVYTTSSDDIRHYGVLMEPNVRTEVAVLWVHGLYQSFYTEPALSIGREIAKNDFLFLSGNNRGHDFGASLKRENNFSIPGGGGWERFVDCVKDIQAWIDYLHVTYALNKIFLLGHSLGGRKALYYQYIQNDPTIHGLALLSTGTNYSDSDQTTYEKAERMVADGKGKDLVPWPSEGCSMSAQTYLQHHDSESVFKKLFQAQSDPPISSITIPILSLFGEQENIDGQKSREQDLISQSAVRAPSTSKAIVSGADHFYTGRENEVGSLVSAWISTIINSQ